MTLATTRADIEAGDELQQLKALVAEQQQRLEALEGRKESPDGGDTKEKRSTRRQMLKLAGATLAGAAGAAALKTIPAWAADGDFMSVGNVYTETLGFGTGVFQSSLNGTAIFGQASGYGHGVAGFSSTYGAGVFGYDGATVGTGVHGVATGALSIGVRGDAYGGTGVVGTNYSGTYGIGVTGIGFSGTYGHGTFWGAFNRPSPNTYGAGTFSSGPIGVLTYTTHTQSRALYAYTGMSGSVAIQAKQTNPGNIFTGAAPAIVAQSYNDTAIIGYGYLGGVWGQSSSTYSAGVIASGHYNGVLIGPDLKLFGSGRMIQVANITGGVGAPNFTSYAGYFEMVRAGDGAMWINRGTGALKASWKRVNAVRADSADGSGNSYKPLRLIDTRLATGAGGQATGGAAGNGTTKTYIAAGINGTVVTQNIPSDAVAVFGNLTAVGGAQGGFMAVHPAGAAYNPAVDPATFNFSAHGVTSNGFFCGLGTGANAGKIAVYVGVYGTSKANLIIDITGYVQ